MAPFGIPFSDFRNSCPAVRADSVGYNAQDTSSLYGSGQRSAQPQQWILLGAYGLDNQGNGAEPFGCRQKQVFARFDENRFLQGFGSARSSSLGSFASSSIFSTLLSISRPRSIDRRMILLSSRVSIRHLASRFTAKFTVAAPG